MLYKFIQSARLTPTSVLEEQDVQDQGSATGNLCQLFAYSRLSHANRVEMDLVRSSFCATMRFLMAAPNLGF